MMKFKCTHCERLVSVPAQINNCRVCHDSAIIIDTEDVWLNEDNMEPLMAQDAFEIYDGNSNRITRGD